MAGLPKSKPTKGHLHIKYMLALEMHRLAILHLVVVVAGAIRVLGHPGDAGGVTPLVHFWEKALPGTPVPEVIADLVHKGSTSDRCAYVSKSSCQKNCLNCGGEINYLPYF